jgi:hypothetical protein
MMHMLMGAMCCTVLLLGVIFVVGVGGGTERQTHGYKIELILQMTAS